jgi:hypothetical protein
MLSSFREDKLKASNQYEVKMSKSLKIALIVLGVLAGAAVLVGGGFMLGRSVLNRWGFNQQGMMFNRNGSAYDGRADRRSAPGMMGGRNYNNAPASRDGFGMGMMRGANTNYSGTPLTMDESKQAIQTYLDNLKNPDLALKEVMVFNNNAYGMIVEKSTGKGALEVLVNPVNKFVTPEMGPNMMWNLKYGGMGGRGRGNFGCTDGCIGNGQPAAGTIAEMTVTPTQAVQAAQIYLDKNLAGTKAANDPITFNGYYTLDYSKDGKPAGMLSVNGYNGQVWLHTWHGTFIEEWTAE